jgi:hypothetical protein
MQRSSWICRNTFCFEWYWDCCIIFYNIFSLLFLATYLSNTLTKCPNLCVENGQRQTTPNTQTETNISYAAKDNKENTHRRPAELEPIDEQEWRCTASCTVSTDHKHRLPLALSFIPCQKQKVPECASQRKHTFKSKSPPFSNLELGTYII